MKDGLEPSSVLLCDAYRYWLDRCRDRAMPSRSDIDPVEMVGFLPNVALLDVKWDPMDFRYRVIGTAIDYHSSATHTGEWVSEIPGRAPPSSVWDNFLRVAETGLPSDSAVPYVGPHKDFVKTAQITLPLSYEGQVVDMLLLVVDYIRYKLPETPDQCR